jgi:hypothetical protein
MEKELEFKTLVYFIDKIPTTIIGKNEFLPILKTMPDAQSQKEFKQVHNDLVDDMVLLVANECKDFYIGWRNICKNLNYSWIVYLRCHLTVLYYESIVGQDVTPIQKLDDSIKRLGENLERLIKKDRPLLSQPNLDRTNIEDLVNRFPAYKLACQTHDAFITLLIEKGLRPDLFSLRKSLNNEARKITYGLTREGTEGLVQIYPCSECRRLDGFTLGQGITACPPTCHRAECKKSYAKRMKQLRRLEKKKSDPLFELKNQWKTLDKKRGRCKGLDCVKSTDVTNDSEQLCKNCWLEINSRGTAFYFSQTQKEA